MPSPATFRQQPCAIRAAAAACAAAAKAKKSQLV